MSNPDRVSFHSQGCKLLGGFYHAQGTAPHPTILLLHGIPGTEKNFDLAQALHTAGFNVLYFHYRGCWGSEGDYTVPGLKDDIHAATEWALSQPEVDASRLALAGNSLGGYLTLAVGATEPRFKALAAICPLIDPLTANVTLDDFNDFALSLTGTSGPELHAQWNALTPIPRFAPQLTARPTLLITGDQDSLFSPEHYQPFINAVPSVHWQRLAAGDHGFSACRAELAQAVVEWLSSTI